MPSENKLHHDGEQDRTKKVSPITQLGLPFPGGMFDPADKSKKPPTQLLDWGTWETIMSWGFIDQAVPPKDIVTVTLVVQAEYVMSTQYIRFLTGTYGKQTVLPSWEQLVSWE